MNAGDYFYTQAGATFLNLSVPSLPSNLYVAAFTDSVTATGVGTEVADPASNSVNYARKVLPASAFTAVGGGVFRLTNVLDFNQASGGNWGTIVSVAIVTVATGSMTGNVVLFGDLDTSKTVNEFDTLRIANGTSFQITIS